MQKKKNLTEKREEAKDLFHKTNQKSDFLSGQKNETYVLGVL